MKRILAGAVVVAATSLSLLGVTGGPASAAGTCTKNINGSNVGTATCTGLAPGTRWRYVVECYPNSTPGGYAAWGTIVTGDGTSVATCRTDQRALDGGIFLA
ncbi:hypothetical protein AB0M43_32590 [Longispora sp. NPDC051575]|uniref:hypothetical protein n=1 Tax=Longispora sp. NPDC051575 TaxID=3154943 RepID=UPI00344837E8